MTFIKSARQMIAERGLRKTPLGGVDLGVTLDTGKGIGINNSGARMTLHGQFTPSQFLTHAQKMPSAIIVRGAKGVTAGGFVQLLLSQEVRPLIRGKIDVVFLVRDPLRDWMRSFVPSAVFPRISSNKLNRYKDDGDGKGKPFI
jgi:hypothetical protein